MEVTDLKGNIIRTIEFFINPYNNKTSLTKLDSVRIAAPDVETKVYAFHYKDTYQVPSIYTTAVDHWGFCNGSDHWVGNEVTVSDRYYTCLWVISIKERLLLSMKV